MLSIVLCNDLDRYGNGTDFGLEAEQAVAREYDRIRKQARRLGFSLTKAEYLRVYRSARVADPRQRGKVIAYFGAVHMFSRSAGVDSFSRRIGRN